MRDKDKNKKKTTKKTPTLFKLSVSPSPPFKPQRLNRRINSIKHSIQRDRITQLLNPASKGRSPRSIIPESFEIGSDAEFGV